MTDQAPVEDQPGYTGAIQRELEGLVGFSSVSRVRRNALREPEYFPVSNAVPNETKLQYQYITTDMSILQTVLSNCDTVIIERLLFNVWQVQESSHSLTPPVSGVELRPNSFLFIVTGEGIKGLQGSGRDPDLCNLPSAIVE